MAGKIACFVVLCIVAAARSAEALTCTDVDAHLKNCVPFLTNTGLLGTCCDGVKELNAVASTTVDRQTACTCLEAAAKSMLLLDLTKAANLPNTCGVELPFKISLDMACSTVV
ncbi:PREDICTED: non-specific lipid-transfer protein 2-like [Nicotiana attenuata]|uniref:Non-specific lipid-transfer protein n=1 Tax=Nicotiana attenuata TaxID=49451 RepID=A0A1J6L787_NICAT|nr:PREDICTED: non-specific lipid-transfer protein 2-like [Nicotiana attenuata]OIT26977.1 non-specific lipid-transfer protein 2 [Nicotiana attenuata]